MKRFVGGMILVLTISIAATGEDKAPAPLRSAPGSLCVVIEGPGVVHSVSAVKREEKKRYAATASHGGRRWVFAALGSGIYDVLLLTPTGTVEGVRMTFVDMLGRPEPPGEKHGRLSKDAKRVIRAKVQDMFRNKMFENHGRLLAIDSHAREARVLVEKIRDQRTSLGSPKPILFWRVEIWPFHYKYGGWVKGKYETIVRRNIKVADFANVTWTAEPALGGIVVKAGERTELRYKLPERLDAALSRLPGMSLDGKMPTATAPADR